MDTTTQAALANIHSTDKDLQNQAYYAVIEITDKSVDWAYDVWDAVVADLAKSDPDKRMLKDFAALLAVTKDERFVTARHCM